MPEDPVHAPRISVKIDERFKKDLVATCQQVGLTEAVFVRAAVTAAIDYVRAHGGRITLPLIAVPNAEWERYQEAKRAEPKRDPNVDDRRGSDS